MNTQTLGAPTDKRALLATVGHRLVRAVASESTPYSEALFGIVASRKRSWELGEWEAAIGELDTSPLTVAAWLTAEHARARQ